MSGDSHTNFDSRTFTAGAVGGAATLAAALGAGLQRHRDAQQNRWRDWTIEQLRAALDYSEALRRGQFRDLQRSRAENAMMHRAAADRAFIIRREQARTLRARR